MARRKTPKDQKLVRESARKLVLMGDVREAPVEIREGGRTFRPVVALWVRAEDGYPFGQLVDEPGHPAESLVQALRTPMFVPEQPQPPANPSQIVLFNEDLARQVQALLAPLRVEILISPPFEPFDDLFAEVFAHLQQAQQGWYSLDLPDDILRPLVSAVERFWRVKPWEYVFDYPPFSLVPGQGDARPLFASILGARGEVFGVALYTSLEDYEATLTLGESQMRGSPETASPTALDEAATEVLEVIRHRVILVSFEPKDEVDEDYRKQLALGGWSRRLSMVPTFAVLSGGQEPAPLNTQDASEVALALDALAAVCQRHRKQLADDELPVHDAVEVSLTGRTVRLEVSVPAEDPSAPPATGYRFKVSLAYQKEVWRTIDVLSSQTLEDLHYAIQDAFDWDDDHLYAFFMSGKAWDPSTEYIRPEGQEPGTRSARVRLDRLELRPRKRFLYIFDFGDEWRHEIRVEKAGLPPDTGEYPRIVEEHGEAPPQYGDLDEDYEEDE